jgi:deoxyribonuclease-4
LPGVLFGGHVKTAGGLVTAVDRAEQRGFEVAQLFTQSPRAWRERRTGPADLEAYRSRQQASASLQVTLCHATYLINLATDDEALLMRSAQCLAANLTIADGIGAAGLVLHVGSHRGSGLDQVLPQITLVLRTVLDGVGGTTPILLENTAGAGGTIGRCLDELAVVIEALDGDERVGVCLDSQHLWASGVDIATAEGMDAVVRDVDRLVGLERLQALHLNDSVPELGSNRDRHAPLGRGTIGAGLAAFLGHPAVQHLPVAIETEGLEGGDAGAADVAVARQLHEAGQALYR